MCSWWRGKWNSITRCTAADEARDFADKKFSFSAPLKGRDTLKQNTRQADVDNAKCVGGLARAYTAVLKCPTLATVGQSILEVLEPIIMRRESEMNACLDGLGTEDCPVPPEDLLDEIRSAIGGVVGTNELGVVTDQGDGIASPVRARLLLAGAFRAEDPDA